MSDRLREAFLLAVEDAEHQAGITKYDSMKKQPTVNIAAGTIQGDKANASYLRDNSHIEIGTEVSGTLDTSDSGL